MTDLRATKKKRPQGHQIDKWHSSRINCIRISNDKCDFGRYIHAYTLCVRLSLSVSCVSPPLVPIFGQFLFLSSFVIISSQPCVFSWLVPSPVLLIILFAPSFPSLYKSSVFPVSLASINVILVCTCSPAISMFPNKVFKRSSTPPRSWHPRTSVTLCIWICVYIYTEQNYKRNTFVFAPIFHELNSNI